MIEKDSLQNRGPEPRGAAAVLVDIKRVKGQAPEVDVQDTAHGALADRIAAARAVLPPREHDLHCGHCFGRGRDAAVAAFEGGAAQTIGSSTERIER